MVITTITNKNVSSVKVTLGLRKKASLEIVLEEANSGKTIGSLPYHLLIVAEGEFIGPKYAEGLGWKEGVYKGENKGYTFVGRDFPLVNKDKLRELISKEGIDLLTEYHKMKEIDPRLIMSIGVMQ